MADKDFVVKNGFAVNGAVLVVNTSTSRVGINTSAPDAALKVIGTANVTGNAAFSANVTVTGNVYANVVGTANNATNLGGVAAAQYAFTNTVTANASAAYTNAVNFSSNATNLTSGTVNTALLPSTINIGTALNVGSNVTVGVSQISVGSLTVNSTTISGGSNALFNVVNAAAFTIGTALTANSTVMAFSNSSTLIYGGVRVSNSVTGGGSLVLADSPTLTALNTGNTTVTGFVNASASVNASALTVGTAFVANNIAVTIGSNSALTYGGVTLANSATGTGSMVLSTGPTLTGTTTTAVLNSGNTTVTGFVNASAAVNAASHTVGGTFVANATALTLGSNSVLTYGGVTLANSVTGTGSMVLSANPTFTGNVTTAVLNSGNTTITGFVNASASVNAASYAVGGLFVANSTALALSSNSTLTYGGVTLSNAVTGTGSMVLSANPTFTGNVTVATINAKTVVANGALGNTNQVLLSNSTGGIYWGSTITPTGGSNTSVQFNDSGSANGTSGFTFDKASNNALVANTITAGASVVANNGWFLNNPSMTTTATVPTGLNALSVGPINILNGVTITIPNGQRWVVL